MENKGLNTCVACKETSEQVALHYTRMLCNGCRAFFKRTVQGKVKMSECKTEGQCVIDPNTRKLCKACRFEACTRAGVDSSKVQQPKENCQESILEDQHLYQGMHFDGGQRLIPLSSFSPQTAFPPFSVSDQCSQISQSMHAISPVISLHAPSIGIGLFNQNIDSSFGNGHMTNSLALRNSQLPRPLTSSPPSLLGSKARIWRATSSGNLQPGTETNNMFVPSFHLPYRNSLVLSRPSEAASYMDITRNMSMMGSRYIFNTNSVNINQDAVMSYPSTLSQLPAAGPALFAYAPPLGHSWNTCQSHNQLSGLHFFSSPLSDGSFITDRTTKPMTETTTSFKSSPLLIDAVVMERRHDAIKDHQGKLYDTEVKEEIVDSHTESTNERENTKYKKAMSPRDTPGQESPVVSIKEKSQVLTQNKDCLDDMNNILLATALHGPGRVSCALPSERSSAFMIDMLLRPEQKQSGKSDDNNSRNHSPFSDQTQLYSPTQWSVRQHDIFSMTNASQITHKRNVMKPKSCEDVIHSAQPDAVSRATACERYTYDVRHSTPKPGDGEPSLDDTLEDIDVYNTDDGIGISELPTRDMHNKTETCHGRNINIETELRVETEKMFKIDNYDSDAEDNVQSAQIQHTHLSTDLDKTQITEYFDSGLGTSDHIFPCEQPRTSYRNAENATNSGNAADTHENDENLPVTLSEKRKRHLPAIKEKERGHSINKRTRTQPRLTTKYTSKYTPRESRLREVPENGQNKSDDRDCPSRELLVYFTSDTDSFSEDDTGVLNTKPQPQLTSTPVTHVDAHRSQMFLKLVCGFADYCNNEDTAYTSVSTRELSKNWLEQSHPITEHISPGSLCWDSLNQFHCSENRSEKLEQLETFQKEMMTKVQCHDSYTMTEFKADVCKLGALVRDLDHFNCRITPMNTSEANIK